MRGFRCGRRARPRDTAPRRRRGAGWPALRGFAHEWHRARTEHRGGP